MITLDKITHETAMQVLTKMKLHDILTIITALLLGFGWWNAETRGNSALATTVYNLGEVIKAMQVTQKELALKVEGIDTRETLAQGLTQTAIHEGGERNNEQDRRLTTMETELATMIPDVREIKTRINFVADMLDERSKGKK